VILLNKPLILVHTNWFCLANGNRLKTVNLLCKINVLDLTDLVLMHLTAASAMAKHSRNIGRI
jgi:hypothetical protein